MARIKVKHIVLGTHNWPDADKHFPEVGFLKHEHHHDFNFYVECDVEHHDREIEFIMLRIELMKIIDKKYPGKYMKKFGSSSCEMIAENILNELISLYGDRNWTVSVFEDNIQGGIIEN
tara:strand:+ start:129 stop:485 length:357 start_codon:yes stop_codon:yes gene_type:complete